MPGYFWIGLRTRIDNPFFLPRFFVIIKSMQALSLVKKSFFEEIAKAGDAVALEKVRVEYVGRNGKLTAILRSLGGLPLEERKSIGPVAQALRKEMEDALSLKNYRKFQLSTFNPLILRHQGKNSTADICICSRLRKKRSGEFFQSMNFSGRRRDGVEIEYLISKR